MSNLVVTISAKLQVSGASAAAKAQNDARPLDENGDPIGPAVTAEQYLQAVVEGACLSYRDAYAVDRITATDFIYRFTAQEFADINASADPVVQGFVAEVKAAPYVWLGSQQVIDAMNYVVAQGLLTQVRADEILFYPIPDPLS